MDIVLQARPTVWITFSIVHAEYDTESNPHCSWLGLACETMVDTVPTMALQEI